MKRKEGIALLILVALMAGIITAGASSLRTPGSAYDPLLSLDWIQNTFIPNTVNQAGEKVDEALDSLTGEVQSAGPEGTELRVKRGDVLRLESGSTIVCLAGDIEMTADGEVVDVTAGTGAKQSATALEHRYLAAENTTANFTVTSDTAVVRLTGLYSSSRSGETDYNALATGLKTLGLFKGSDTPYGSGYDLEKEPTRIQGLIMFLRLLGEEQAALSYTGGAVSFPDVPDWALPYVAYAYEKGYTKGRTLPDSQNRVWFGTTDTLAARDYMTFLLRALDYSEGTDFNWLTAIPDARTLGVLTAGEEALLTDKPFLRAQVVYLSWFALDANMAGGRQTLSDRLLANGVMEETTLVSLRNSVKIQRV